MNFRKNLYFSCKHCGRDSYIDDAKFAFDDFGKEKAQKDKIRANYEKTLKEIVEKGEVQ